jgi:hypothetical protein
MIGLIGGSVLKGHSQALRRREVKKILRFLCAAIITAAVAPAASEAAIIASYNFTTDSSSQDTAPNSTADPFVGSSVDAGRSASGNAFVRTKVTGTDPASALSDTDYLSFTVTAADGYQLDLDSLTFSFGGSSPVAGTNGNFTASLVVQSSVGGFGAGNAILFEGSHLVPGGSTAGSFADGGPVLLTDNSFQNLQAVTFQFRFYNTTTDPQLVDRLDNVILYGDVAPIPEPAGLAILGMSAIFLRRSRRSA